MERDFFRSLFSRCELRRDQDSCGPTVDLHSRSPRAHKTKARVFRGETAKYRMDAGDFAARRRQLHNFRVTRLCTTCTRLMNKKLQMHEFC